MPSYIISNIVDADTRVTILVNQNATPYSLSKVQINGNNVSQNYSTGGLTVPSSTANILQTHSFDLLRFSNVWQATQTISPLSTAGAVISSGNIAMTSNVARNVFVNSYAPLTTQGNVGDIWYQTF